MSKANTDKPKRKRVNFAVEAAPGSTVCVAGEFNQWDKTAKSLTDKSGNGVFTGCMNLEPGVYEYKLVINGEWQLDPKCADTVENDQGSRNNVLRIQA